jgi:hypothetical protein
MAAMKFLEICYTFHIREVDFCLPRRVSLISATFCVLRKCRRRAVEGTARNKSLGCGIRAVSFVSLVSKFVLTARRVIAVRERASERETEKGKKLSGGWME